MSNTIKPSTSSSSFSNARATYRVRTSECSKVLCHRQRQGREEYLIRWRTEPETPVPPRAICSWHDLRELTRCLHHVQTYLESRKRPAKVPKTPTLQTQLLNRKRKSPEADPQRSRDTGIGIPTPSPSSLLSRSASVISISSSSDVVEKADVNVYNGILEKKEGWIVAKKSKRVQAPRINAKNLPTPEMLEEARITPVSQAERAIKQAFRTKIKKVPKLFLENTVDDSTPSLDFTFIDEYVLRDGVHRTDPEAYEGCQRPCKPNMGSHVGCEWPKECSCLEYAAVNEQVLQRTEPALYEEYVRQLKAGEVIDTAGLPKRFPYQKPNLDGKSPQTMVPFYLESRNPIYECNLNCNCGPACKSRVVQKGRKVPLTIFKTANRGWGVYCNEKLLPGEFIDTYLGEVVTNEEADRREELAGKDKASYLYSLDKFIGDDDELTADNCYVVDGQYMGGPTRFINHSCEPNCRQHTVSYNKHDLRVYDLAFFAIEYIKPGTELTFDYMDKDEEEEEEVVRKREEAANDPEKLGKVKCDCGKPKCRGYLWV